MRKKLPILTAVLFSIIFLACNTYTVKQVYPGNSLSAKESYIAIVFTNQGKLISLGGTATVYTILLQIDTGMKYYIPFASNNRLYIISVIPGKYKLENFIYLTGYGVAKKNDVENINKAILYSKPEIPDTVFKKANFSKNYSNEFIVEANQIVYIGDYSYAKTTSILDYTLKVTRKLRDDENIFRLIKEYHPTIADDVDIIPIEINKEEENEEKKENNIESAVERRKKLKEKEEKERKKNK